VWWSLAGERMGILLRHRIRNFLTCRDAWVRKLRTGNSGGILCDLPVAVMGHNLPATPIVSKEDAFRVLDPACTAVQLDTLIKAASAVGRVLRISLKRLARA